MPKVKRQQQEQLPPEKDLNPDDVVDKETSLNKRTFVKVNENMSIRR